MKRLPAFGFKLGTWKLNTLNKKWVFLLRISSNYLIKFTEEIFSGKLHFWSVYFHIWTEYGDVLRKSPIQSKYGKIRTRKTPYLDTFPQVTSSLIWNTRKSENLHRKSLFILWKWTDLQQFRRNILLVTTSEYWRPRNLIKFALSLKGQCRYYYVETNQLMMNENQLTDLKMKVWFFTLNLLSVKLQSIQKQTMQLSFTLFIDLEFLLFFVEICVCIR